MSSNDKRHLTLSQISSITRRTRSMQSCTVFLSKQIDRQIDRQINRQIDRQIDRQKDRYIDRQIDRLVNVVGWGLQKQIHLAPDPVTGGMCSIQQLVQQMIHTGADTRGAFSHLFQQNIVENDNFISFSERFT